MKQLTSVCLAISLGTSVLVLAQDTIKDDDPMKQDTTKYERMSKKTVNISGTVADGGETIMADKDGKIWKVSNPDVLKAQQGRHVRVRAHVDADEDKLRVVSVRVLEQR